MAFYMRVIIRADIEDGISLVGILRKDWPAATIISLVSSQIFTNENPGRPSLKKYLIV
jgi:hypothetical protein